jgi:hypothetical protein
MTVFPHEKDNMEKESSISKVRRPGQSRLLIKPIQPVKKKKKRTRKMRALIVVPGPYTKQKKKDEEDMDKRMEWGNIIHRQQKEAKEGSSPAPTHVH